MKTSRQGHRPAHALVVGAGAAGAVVATRLGAAGMRVVCLEQGDWPDPAAYPGRERTWELATRGAWSESPNVRAHSADYPVDATESDIAPMMFSAVGGSTVIYGAQWPRFLPDDFRVRAVDGVADDWPLSYEDLAPYYDRVDRDFGVSGLGGDPAYPPSSPPPLRPLPLGRAGVRVAQAHNALGWHWWPGPNAIASRPYGPLRGCTLRATCGSGCPDGAKASTDVTHWPAAVRHGVRLVTGARVSSITTDARGLATGAVYIDRKGVERHEPAQVVVLAANAVGTARLLLLSATAAQPDGLANGSGLVGRRLMMHPFTRVVGLFSDDLGTSRGQWGQYVQSLEFAAGGADTDFVRGAKWNLNPSGGPLAAALFPWPGERRWGRSLHEHVSAWVNHAAAWGITAEDLPEHTNTVTLDNALTDADGIPAPRLRYRVSDNSRRILDFNVARAEESLRAAGAWRTVSVPLLPEVGWHLLGTARMGDDPATSVVDRWGRAHDVPNLVVADGSVFVTSSSVNPTPTICALALRAADHLLDERRHQRVP